MLGISQNIGAQLNPQGFLIGGHIVFLLVLLARVMNLWPLNVWGWLRLRRSA